MRKLKTENLVYIDRPFVVYVEPGDVVDSQLRWYAKLVGYNLDQMTWGDSPLEALNNAVEVVQLLTGKCLGGSDHIWDESSALDDEPAWRCSRCNEVALKTLFDDYYEPMEEGVS